LKRLSIPSKIVIPPKKIRGINIHLHKEIIILIELLFQGIGSYQIKE
jgi:hypothetical protein